MLRMMGAVLLVGGTGAFGLGQALRLHRRAETLRRLSCAVADMRREIALRQTPMPELLSRMEKTQPPPVQALFSRTGYLLGELGSRSFALIWRQAAEETLRGVLRREELFTVEEIGSWLGRYDAQQQSAALDRVQSQLDEFAIAAASAAKKDGKVKTALGLAAGACSAILLM